MSASKKSPSTERSSLCESHSEELASMLTHVLGAILSVGGLVMMIIVAKNDPLKVTAGAIFGSTLVLLYLASSLYHSVSSHRVKSFFQVVDHSAIYLLIAGTYTPLTLISLRGAWGWSLFGIVWGMAIAGVIIKMCCKNWRDHWISTAIYLVMGWLAIIAIKPIMNALPREAILLLVAGGLSYTGGVVFYSWEKLKYNHSIWHLFVIAGSAFHAAMTILYVLP